MTKSRKHSYVGILIISAVLAYFVTMLHPQMDTAPFLYLSSILGLSSFIYAIRYKSKNILIFSLSTILCAIVHLLGAWWPWQEPLDCAMVCFNWSQMIMLLGGVLLGTLFGVISLIKTIRDAIKPV